MRAVLDTNILVSAAIKKGGKPDRILNAAEAEQFQWLTSEFILAELGEVLGRRHVQHKYQEHVTARKREAYLKRIRAVAEVVTVLTGVDAVPGDPGDNPVLACAVDGSAQYLVTGDRHLLELEMYREVRIVTPAVFLDRLSKS